MPDNDIGWGQGAVNNDIGWGKGASNNSINWGAIHADSPSGDTNLVGGSSFTNTKSLITDGINDYAQVGSSNSLGTGDFSFSCWWKKNSNYGGLVPVAAIWFNTGGSGVNDRYHHLVRFNNNTIQFYQRSSSNTTQVVFYNNTGGWSANQWYHIACVKEGTNGKIYINGSQVVSSNAFSTNTATSSLAPTLNRYSTAYSDANQDESAYWTRALSATEVTSIYNSGVPNDISSLSPLHWFRMEQEMFSQVGNSGSSNIILSLYNGAVTEADVPS